MAVNGPNGGLIDGTVLQPLRKVFGKLIACLADGNRQIKRPLPDLPAAVKDLVQFQAVIGFGIGWESGRRPAKLHKPVIGIGIGIIANILYLIVGGCVYGSGRGLKHDLSQMGP